MTGNEQTYGQLALQIRAAIDSGTPVWTPLRTSQRIIRRVTDGIYREPWAAFRELAANAYDADATNVTIITDFPQFGQVIIRDNGNGMSPETVAYMVHNIGGSSKRTRAGIELHTVSSLDTERSPSGRHLIGKIGIGLFAVAQLTQHFQIVTKEKNSRVQTSATVLLNTNDESENQNHVSGDEIQAGQVKILAETVPDSEINSHGTTIILHSLRPEIVRALQSVRRWRLAETPGPDGNPVEQAPQFHISVNPGLLSKDHQGYASNLPWSDSDSPSTRFGKLYDAACSATGKESKLSNLDHFDEYLKLLWQLSLSLPLKYVREHPFDINGNHGLIVYDVPTGRTQAEKASLKPSQSLREKFNLKSGAADQAGGFNVTVDGVLLSRPIVASNRLVNEKSRIPSPVILIAKEEAPFDTRSLKLAGGPLKFEAYLYWNSKIVPKENAGVLIRVREASGSLFDPTFLKYQVSEQTRLRQITAEIYVYEGLDGAINIDRESFNFSHPHYLYIQRWLHKALRLMVNRLKALADEDLKRAKFVQANSQREALITRAIGVWEKRQGLAADPPFSSNANFDIPVPEVGNVEIAWSAGAAKSDTHMAAAIAAVLEAYGVLSYLNAADRARLINDLIEVLNNNG